MKPQILHTILTKKKFLLSLCIIISGFVCAQSPAASFTASPQAGCKPLLVVFTNNSTGNPTKYEWDLGNGNSSGDPATASTIYYTPGVYAVSLKVTNSSGSDDTTIYVTVYDEPVVDFSAANTSGCAPFTTVFNDQSSTPLGSIVKWEWDFGDGTAPNTDKNPTHTFDKPGNYNITLSATSSFGCVNAGRSRASYITVLAPLKIDFDVSSSKTCKPPETIDFASNSTGPGLFTYSWDFGDNTPRGSNRTTKHTYLQGGTYSIKLIISNNLGCSDSLEKKDFLPINNIVSTIAGPDTVCINSTASFTNSSNPVPKTFYWDWGDSVYSSESIETRLFTNTGVYTLKTVNSYATCTDTATKKITVIDLPVVDFKADDTASCKVPFTVNFTDASLGEIKGWEWDFGDNSTPSNLSNPSHTYTVLPPSGQQTVTLKVTDIYGCSNSKSVPGFIKIQEPVVSINTIEGGGCIPYTFKPNANITAVDGVSSYLWEFGDGPPATTSALQYPTMLYTTLGEYDIKLTVKTNDGCQVVTIVPAGVKVGPKPNANFSTATTRTCAGTAIQFSDASTPAADVDQWLWEFGDNNSSTIQNPVHAYNDSVGNYTVRLIVRDNGCSDTLTKTDYITIDPALALFRPVYNCINKKQVFFKDSSILALSYVWEFGDGGTSISPSPTHTFADYQAYPVSLIVTNGACSDTLTQEIKLINEVPDFITIKDSACKSDTISFKATNINEDNISNYIWDFGDGTSDTSKFIRTVHKYDSAGIFTVKLTVTDIHGCNESVTKTSTIHILSPKADFITNAQGVCSKKDIIFTDKSTTADGNNSIVGWQWKFGDGQTSNFTNPPPASVPHSYLIDGLYFPKLIVTDVLGCQDSVTNTIPLIVTNPIAAFTADKIVTCNKDTIAFKNTSSGNKLAYQWDFNDGSTSTDSIPKKYYTANGLYNVTLTVTDLYGCSNTVTRDSYIDVKEVTAGFTTSATRGSCLPFEVKFTDTSLNESFIFWRYGDGSSSEFANPNHKYVTSDTFNVRLVAYRGERGTKCTDTAYIDIIVKAPIATLTYSPLEGCAPLGVTFNITSDIPLLYTWDFGDGNISAAETTTTDTTHVYSYPQSYTPSVLIRDPLDQSKCKIPIIGKDVIKLYSSLVNFAVKDTTLVCDNGNVAFKNLTISGSPVASYSWDFGDGSPASPDKEPVHFYNVEGFYDVTLIIKTVFGCTDFLTKKSYIRVAKKPAIAIGGITEYCGLSPVTLQGTVVSSDATSITWSWNFGNGNTSPLQNPPAQDYPAIGNYPVNLIAKSNSGCSDTATVNINIHPIPTVSAGSDTTVCLGSTAALQATGADDYTWQPASNLSCTICSNPIANPTDSITYTVTGATVFGCTYTDEIFIDVKKPFTLTGLQAQDSICLGKSIQLNVVGAELYSWSPSTGLNSTTTPIVVAAPVVSTTYKVIGSDNKNCFTDSATIDLKVNPNPTVNAGEDKLLHLGNSVPLVIQYSTDVINWLWSPATGLSCSNCPAPIATPESSTTYSITVANNSKCTATDQVFIKVVCDNSNLFLPTAFTPNNDGLNDWFYPMGVGLFKIQSLRIFNRYGQVVFLKANFNPNDRSAGWDGKYKGKNSDLGAYIYTLEVICKNGEVLTINGKILLIQ